MGTIQIRDGFDRETFSSTRWSGQITVDLNDIEQLRVTVSPDAPFRDVDMAVEGDPDGTDRLPFDRWWLLLAPLVLAVAFGAAVLVVGPAAFDTGRPGSAGLVAFGLLAALFSVSLLGTASLHEDVRRVADADVDWTPNPWLYHVGGALVLLAVRLAVGLPTAGPNALLEYLIGSFVVALAMSSLVVGPIYMLQRRRHLGVP